MKIAAFSLHMEPINDLVSESVEFSKSVGKGGLAGTVSSDDKIGLHSVLATIFEQRLKHNILKRMEISQVISRMRSDISKMS